MSLALSLNLQETGSSYESIATRIQWDRDTTWVLLETYEKFLEKFSRKSFSQMKIWKEIAKSFDELDFKCTGEQCKMKLERMKFRYQAIKRGFQKTGNQAIKRGFQKTGNFDTTWEFYDIMDELFSDDAVAKSVPQVNTVEAISKVIAAKSVPLPKAEYLPKQNDEIEGISEGESSFMKSDHYRPHEVFIVENETSQQHKQSCKEHSFVGHETFPLSIVTPPEEICEYPEVGLQGYSTEDNCKEDEFLPTPQNDHSKYIQQKVPPDFISVVADSSQGSTSIAGTSISSVVTSQCDIDSSSIDHCNQLEGLLDTNPAEPSIVSPQQLEKIPSNKDIQNPLMKVASIPKGKYTWNKVNYCKFCKKSVVKIYRHVASVHANEEEVREVSLLQKKSKERRRKLEKIRREGNFFHNQEVVKNNSGIFIPQVRVNHQSLSSVNDYAPCRHCLGYFKKRFLWLHNKICSSNKSNTKDRRVLVKSQIRGRDLSVSASFVSDILADMILDGLTEKIINDSLILKFGESLYEKRRKGHTGNYVRQCMRQCARLLEAAQELEGDIAKMEQLIQPHNFEVVKMAVKKVAHFNEKTTLFGIAGLPLKLGHNLKNCANILISQAIVNSDEESKKKLEGFVSLMETEYISVSANALTTIKQNRFNKPKVLTLAKDIKKLNDYITTEQTRHIKACKNGNKESYSKLSQLTLVSLLLFNRRRSGEIQQVKVSDYKKGLEEKMSCDDIIDELGSVERLLISKLRRIEIVGKKGRGGVPVLLRPVHIESINALLETRDEMGILPENPFIFARTSPEAKTPLDACFELRKLTIEARLSAPERVRSTHLRKHIATLSQIVNLSQQELQQLASFMGHDLNVHLDYYRMPEDLLQITKVCRLLVAAEEGKFSRGEGKNLSDIDINKYDLSGETCNEELGTECEEIEDHFENDPDCQIEATQAGGVGMDRPKRKSWSTEEKEKVEIEFEEFLKSNTLPGKKIIGDFLDKNRDVCRTWKNIKDYIRNKNKRTV